MIVIEMRLVSARGRERDADLGTIVIDNVSGGGARRDYRCRAYRKGALEKSQNNAYKMIYNCNPYREAVVRDHAAEAEPVGNLVAKALHLMGFKHE